MSRSLNPAAAGAILQRRLAKRAQGLDELMPQDRTNTSIRPLDAIAYAAPLLVIVALWVIYLVAPQFYLAYVLEINFRESQAVEIATVIALVIAIVALAWAAARLWRTLPAASDAPPGLPRLLHRYGAAGFVSLILLASVFFLGEEINWGQTIQLWFDPTHKLPLQTNVHNNIPGISVQGLGSIGMACAFFVAPLLWAFRHQLKLPLPPALAPAIPEGPTIACLAVAMAWKWFKDVYVMLFGTARDDTFYWGFVEQINEQKELLVAMSLMLYALYRIAAVRRATRETQLSAPPRREREFATAIEK